MPSVNLPAHFDGQQILLDTPYPLEPNTRLVVTILPEDVEDEERQDWLRMSLRGLAAAYGDDEPEYTLADIKEWNPEYEERRF